MSDDKRCGTCRWWYPNIHDTSVGQCGVPLPISVFVPDKTVMDANQLATNCLCYERRERDASTVAE